ncbi:MAG TPA: hypothetical protein VN372_12290 [Methanospirillum sp.]|nr:hypothetical protein [Methanospirillum sp.]
MECGLDEELVKDSLKRLSRNLLIVFRGDRVRARSVGEFMITNQMMHDPDPDLIIENGVVRVRESSAVGMNKEPGGNVL